MTYAVRLLMVCFSAPSQKYIIPARRRSSIPAGQTFKLGAPHLIKGGSRRWISFCVNRRAVIVLRILNREKEQHEKAH
jgi:hypothetical protein